MKLKQQSCAAHSLTECGQKLRDLKIRFTEITDLTANAKNARRFLKHLLETRTTRVKCRKPFSEEEYTEVTHNKGWKQIEKLLRLDFRTKRAWQLVIDKINECHSEKLNIRFVEDGVERTSGETTLEQLRYFMISRYDVQEDLGLMRRVFNASKFELINMIEEHKIWYRANAKPLPGAPLLNFDDGTHYYGLGIVHADAIPPSATVELDSQWIKTDDEAVFTGKIAYSDYHAPCADYNTEDLDNDHGLVHLPLIDQEYKVYQLSFAFKPYDGYDYFLKQLSYNLEYNFSDLIDEALMTYERPLSTMEILMNDLLPTL